MVIRPALPEILGGVVPPPQMLLGCQKQQMLLTVNIKLYISMVLHKHSVRSIYVHLEGMLPSSRLDPVKLHTKDSIGSSLANAILSQGCVSVH